MQKSDQEIEFYKILKEEYTKFLTYVENLWKLKIIVVGSIISFAILNEQILGVIISEIPDNTNTEIAAIGILTLPIMAFIIDLKILETVFHLKNISQYLNKNLNHFEIAKKWEVRNWEFESLKIGRTLLILFSTIGISFLILTLSVYIAKRLPKFDYYQEFVLTAKIVYILGLILSIIIAIILFKKKKTTTPNKVQNVHAP